MITFEQLAILETILVWVGGILVFGGGFLYVRRADRQYRRGRDARIKDEMLIAERMRARQEAEQAAVQRTGE